MEPLIDAETLRAILDYNPETGDCTWKVKRTRVAVGDVAGWVDKSYQNTPYRKVRIKGRNYQVSRLAVLWMTGEWPAEEVDHRDRDTLNNRWANLRQATRSENQRNRVVRRDSGTKVKGVNKRRSAHGSNAEYHVAQIGVGNKRVYLGSFKTAKGAATAYENAAKLLHGDFARTKE